MLRLLCLVAVVLGSSGCFTLGYLGQAGVGQLDLIRRGKPIAKVVNDERQPRRVRYLLAQVKRVKAWGQARGLEPTESYKRYSDLGRRAAVWVVQGCAPLAFEVRRWSFPIVGSVPYLGFFDEAKARAYAAELAREEGLDVAVRGAAAYSTLGWFNDPVLSTMLGEGPEALGDLAETILHESVHATVYLPNQSAFDESLASFVAERLTPVWLAEAFGPEGAPLRAYLEGQRRSERFVARMQRAYEELAVVYGTADYSVERKKAEKARVLEALRADLGLKQPPNNASLAGFRTYASGKGGFERLFAACQGWERFLGAVRTLKAKDFARPQQDAFDPVLDQLAARACPPPSASGAAAASPQ